MEAGVLVNWWGRGRGEREGILLEKKVHSSFQLPELGLNLLDTY